MRFVFADSVDTVDPEYDFVADRHSAGRTVHRDDQYPHEFLEQAPYDGILSLSWYRWRRAAYRKIFRSPVDALSSRRRAEISAVPGRALPRQPFDRRLWRIYISESSRAPLQGR